MNALTPRDKNKTSQVYGTPTGFFEKCKKKWPFVWDLAASEINKKCDQFLSEKSDSLKCCWHKLDGWHWLNPPFKNITPWADKCLEESELGARIVMLTPASVGSNWFRDFIFRKAEVWFLNGRLTFQGETKPFPKDCMISIFDRDAPIRDSVRVWDWKKDKLY